MESNPILPQVSDGLLPLPVDVDVILWLDPDMDGVKPALVCLGRCLSRLQVRPLPFHQAQDLVPFRLEDHREYSLAEVNEILGTGGEGGYSARDVALRRHSQPWGGGEARPAQPRQFPSGSRTYPISARPPSAERSGVP